jgi:hypothetical protein
MRITSGWAHHINMVGIDGRVPASVAPNLGEVFKGVPIRCCS